MVRDAAEVVKVAQRVQVTVTEVDFPRKRIALSLKSKPDFEKKVGNTGPRPPGCGDSGDWFTVAAQKGRK
jgi:protein Tex